jgi:hypothetical protein
MKDSTKLSIGLLIVALGLFWPKIKESIKLPDDNFTSSTVNVVFEKVDEPSDALKEKVTGISELVVGDDADDDKIRLAQFYAQLSKIVRNEPGFLKTTGQFREYNSTAGQINYAGISLKGKYAGLGQAIDQAIVDQIGLESIELDIDRRDDLAKILAAISWELWHE